MESKDTLGEGTLRSLLVSITSPPERKHSPLASFSCSGISDGALGMKRSAQDKTKAAEVKKEAEASTKVTKTQRADGQQKSEATLEKPSSDEGLQLRPNLRTKRG